MGYNSGSAANSAKSKKAYSDSRKLKSAKRVKSKVPPMDSTFFILVIAIVSFGLVMLFSASFAYSYYRMNDSYHFIKKQLVWAILGFIFMMIASRIPYKLYKKFAWPIYIVTLLLLAVTLVMPAINGAKRWIVIGGFQFQPSEVAKFTIIVIFALLIEKNFEKMGTFKKGVIPFLCVLGPVCLLTVLQPHISGTILIMSLAIMLMFVGGTKFRWFAIGGSIVAVGGTAAILASSKVAYAVDRVRFWIDPFLAPQDEGFQTIQSLYAIGSGGLLGQGLGGSKQKHLYIPEPQNDFIFSIICEELGFIGATLVIALFALLVWRGIVIAIRSKDKFGSLLALGLTIQVGIQAVLNIGVVTNTIPNTGISLPFFSYGGTSLMMLMAEMGIVLQVSRYANMEKT